MKLSAKAVFAAAACALLAASMSASAADKFLADRHTAKGLNCQMCHGPDRHLHGLPPQGRARGQDRQGQALQSPQAPHYGADLDCTNCHLGHMESENFCDQCHQFGFKVP